MKITIQVSKKIPKPPGPPKGYVKKKNGDLGEQRLAQVEQDHSNGENFEVIPNPNNKE